jgi:prophage regulatory protein
MNILNVNQVSKKTSLGRSSVYAYTAAGKFPASVRIGVGKVGWVEAEVEAWLQARVEARDVQKVTA